MAGSAHTLGTLRIPRTSASGLAVIGEIPTSWTADDTNGSIPSLAIEFSRDVQLLEIETNPGATAPTANYDITLVDSDGADVLWSAGLNKSASATELVPIIYTGTTMLACLKAGSYTLTLANNVVNSAVGTIAIRYLFL